MLNRIVSGLALAAALAITATTAEAQRSISFGIAGGLSAPISDLSDTHQSGWNGAASLTYNVPASNVGFRFEGFINQFKAEDNTAGNLLGDLSIAGGSVNALYHLSRGAIRPYVIGGVGAYNQKFDGAGDDETNLGINAGAGIKFVIGGLNTFAEARLHTVSLGDSESRQFIPVVFGVEF